MRIIVSDTSCLIDLRKASLLKAFACLPYEILIPDVLFEHEFVKFTEADCADLINNGVQIADLSGSEISRVSQLQTQHSSLSAYDCFAFVVAENHPGCILLTGDRRLGLLSTKSGIETHGVLWVVDEIHKHGLARPKKLHKILKSWESDKTVLLPPKELRSRIRQFESLI